MNKGLFDIDDLDSDIELESLEDISDETVKNNIVNYSSKKLCYIIVSNRYLNMNKELAVLAMQELSNRRQSGDNFNFEDFIEKAIEELPQINFSMPDLRTVLSNISGNKK